MPLPRGLASKSGRRKAALLLATTKGAPLRLRFLVRPGASAEPFGASGGGDLSAFAPALSESVRVETLRDPFGEFGLGPARSSEFKLPGI